MPIPLNEGFYFVKFRTISPYPETNGWTVGRYSPDCFYPWQVIGSDEIYKNHELIVGPMIPAFPEELKGT